MSDDAPRVTHARSAFRLEYSVEVTIDAPPARVWELLTDASGFTRWNSTVESLEGTIADGETIALRARVAPARTFKLKIGDVVPEKAMTWSDGMAPFFRGVRTFAIDADGDATRFSMTEVFKGMMLPMIAGSLPDFAPVFEQYARDLKRASEAG
jgi:uncharacterized protein YndB with AHSA1/START domain